MTTIELNDRPTIIIIPANPGWYVSSLREGANHLTDDPIVAWEIARYDARPVRDRPGRREPIRRYLLPIITNDELNANVIQKIDGWLLGDPTGLYHEWSGAGPKFDTTDDALAYLISQRAQHQMTAAAAS
jgi:hypothetical protein